MENVPEVIGTKNINNFKKWELKLESLGYNNFVKILNAKDFGVPQNRRRCFMISILGDYAYDMPINMKLKYHLKDFLEKQVDEKYYLSENMINYITANNEKWTGNNDKSLVNKSIASTINTGEGSRRCDASNYVSDELIENADLKIIDIYNKNYLKNNKVIGTIPAGYGRNQGCVIQEDDKVIESGWLQKSSQGIKHQSNTVYDSRGLARTLTACDYKCPMIIKENDSDLANQEPKVKREFGLYDDEKRTHQAGSVYNVNGLSPILDTATGGNRQPMILINEATKKGYAVAHDGDGVYINRPHQKRGCVQKGMIQTIKTSCDDVGVVVNDYSEKSLKRIEKNIVSESEETVGTITANAMQSINHQNCHLIAKDEPQLVGGIGEKKSNGGTQWYQQDQVYDGNGIAMCHPANLPDGSYKYQMPNLRIRKLTPKECLRLMGFQDNDYEAIKDIGMSDSMIYHQAGDSIVTTVLMAIFSPMFSQPSKHREIIANYIENIKNGYNL